MINSEQVLGLTKVPESLLSLDEQADKQATPHV